MNIYVSHFSPVGQIHACGKGKRYESYIFIIKLTVLGRESTSDFSRAERVKYL